MIKATQSQAAEASVIVMRAMRKMDEMVQDSFSPYALRIDCAKTIAELASSIKAGDGE